MKKVLVCGITGKMGTCTARAVIAAPDMLLVGGFNPKATRDASIEICGENITLYADLAEAITAVTPDVVVDFTHPLAVEANIRVALKMGVDCVVGTTGLSQEKLEELITIAPPGCGLFVAPNFTTGAVLMMRFAQIAARYFPDIEIIEFHHDNKADAPSGTAIRTAQMIAASKELMTDAPGSETELEGMAGARGALVEGIPVHSVRTNGHVAHQEVIMGSKGQTLTIRHDSIDRESYAPGILLAIRKVSEIDGLLVGLDKLMD